MSPDHPTGTGHLTEPRKVNCSYDPHWTSGRRVSGPQSTSVGWVREMHTRINTRKRRSSPEFDAISLKIFALSATASLSSVQEVHCLNGNECDACSDSRRPTRRVVVAPQETKCMSPQATKAFRISRTSGLIIAMARS